MKTKKKKLSDNGIRLKPKETNVLENYSKFIKTKKKKKKKKKKKRSVKKIEIHKKIDPMDKIIQTADKKKEIDEIIIEDKESKDEDKESKGEIKKVRVDKKPQDLSEKDDNIKKLKITASLKPDKDKEGGGFTID